MTVLRLLPLVVVLAACDSAVSDVGGLRAEDLTLTTDAPAYASGDVATLSLRNGGDTTGDAGTLPCAPLEVETAGGWTLSEIGNERVCPAVVVPLEPGETATADVDLDGVRAGTYRFTLRAEGGTAATAPFEVR